MMLHLPTNSFQAGLIRYLGAFLAVVCVMIAAISMGLLYGDELGSAHPVNAGKGIFAPMYRYWIELVILEWSTFLAAVTGYYAVFGPMIGVVLNRDRSRIFTFRLHFASGVLLIVGMLIAVIMRQPMHIRDAVVTTIGFVLLISAICEWFAIRRYRSIA